MEKCSIATLPLQILPERIGYLKFILEGYDGMAVVTTIDNKKGSIVIRYPSSFHDDLLSILEDVSSRAVTFYAE